MSYVESPVQQYLRAGFPLDHKFGPYANIAARDAIPVEDRYSMMMVGVLDSDGSGTESVYYLYGGLDNANWEIFGASTTPAKSYSWTWADGVDVGGTHLDFVISTATEDGEIGSLESCIFFVGGSVQVGNFTIQDNNFVSDSIRVEGTAGEREGTVEVALFYNRAGIGIPSGGGTISIEIFNPSFKADKIRYFEDYEQTGVINLVKDPTVTDSVAGEVIPYSGVHGIIKANGDAINHTNDFDFITKDALVAGEKYALTAIWRGKKFSSALTQVQESSDNDSPTMVSLVVAGDNTTCELFFNEATYANNNGTGDLQLSDFGTPTLTGGTATSPVLSNPVHTAGDTSITFDLSFTGVADGSEVLEIPVADGNSIFDLSGNAMDAGENASANLSTGSIILMQDPFDDSSINPSIWGELPDPDGSTVETTLLTLSASDITAGRFGLYSLNSYSSVNDLIIAQVTMNATNSSDCVPRFQITAAQGDDSDNRALILNSNVLAYNRARLVINDEGGNELNEITVHAFPLTVRIKYVPSTGAIDFEYRDGASWLSLGSSGNVDLGTSVYVSCFANAPSDPTPSDVTFSNLFVSGDNYITEFPS